MKKLILFVFMLLFVIPISFGLTSYNNTGTEDQQYVTGFGVFNENLVGNTIISQAFSSLTNIPLVADLDGDGVNEIIIIDGSDILIRDTNLLAIDGFTLGSGTFSNPIITDIDKDGFAEIIIGHEQEGNISILQFNGTDFIREAFLLYPLPLITGSNEIMINCGDGQGIGEAITCLIVSASSPTGSGARNFSYAGFNASEVGTITKIATNVNTNINYCFSAIPSIVYSDFDSPSGDSRKEFIFTATEFNTLSDEILHILYVDVAESLVTTEDLEITFSSNFNPKTVGGNCLTDNWGKFYTSPLVADIDGITSNGKETIVGINEDSEDFVMQVFRANGNLISTHPETFQADGVILSNPMLANVFGDTEEVEYCVLGHATDDSDCSSEINQCLDLLCGTITSNGIDLPIPFLRTKTVEFKFDTSGRFNVSEGFNIQNILSHGGQNSNQPIALSDLEPTITTDFLSTYGVFRLSDETFNGTIFIKTLDLIFDGVVEDSTCIQVDAQKTTPSKEDIICLTSTQLFYIDDGFSNSPADIIEEETQFNPCVIDSVIKLNETLEILVVVEDVDNDLVSSFVTIYKDDSNEQVSITIGNVSSGQIQPHSFILNKTGNGIIEISAFDIENPNVIDIVTQSFTVANNGIEFGQSKCTLAPEVEILEGVLNVSADATANEGIIDFIEGGSNIFKVSPLIFVLILMIAFTIAVLTTGDRMNDSMISMNKILFLLIGNSIIFIIGALVGAVPFGVLLTLIILGAFGVVLWARRVFTGNSVQ